MMEQLKCCTGLPVILITLTWIRVRFLVKWIFTLARGLHFIKGRSPQHSFISGHAAFKQRHKELDRLQVWKRSLTFDPLYT